MIEFRRETRTHRAPGFVLAAVLAPLVVQFVAAAPLAAQCTRLCSNQSDCCDLPVRPILECVDHDLVEGVVVSVWGYDNPNPHSVGISPNISTDPRLANNIFLEGDPLEGQPFTFEAGRRKDVFIVSFTSTETRTWLLDGTFAEASRDSLGCAARALLPRLETIETGLGGLDGRVAALEDLIPDLGSEVGDLASRVAALEAKAFCVEDGGGGESHGPPAGRAICERDAYSEGLCNAYCVELDCIGAAPRGSPNACEQVLRSYQKKSGGIAPPCACPCAFDLETHLALLEDMAVDTGPGELVCDPAFVPSSLAFQVTGPPFPEGRVEYALSDADGLTCSAVVKLVNETLDEVVLFPGEEPTQLDLEQEGYDACRAVLAGLCAAAEP